MDPYDVQLLQCVDICSALLVVVKYGEDNIYLRVTSDHDLRRVLLITNQQFELEHSTSRRGLQHIKEKNVFKCPMCWPQTLKDRGVMLPSRESILSRTRFFTRTAKARRSFLCCLTPYISNTKLN